MLDIFCCVLCIQGLWGHSTGIGAHFTGGEAESQRNLATCPTSQLRDLT